MSRRVWSLRDPASHGRAPGPLPAAAPAGPAPDPQHELQALQAQLEAHAQAPDAGPGAVAGLARGPAATGRATGAPDLHDRLREQPDFAETAPPEAWLAVAEPALAALQDRDRPAPDDPPAVPDTSPAPRSWQRTAVPTPESGPPPTPAPDREPERGSETGPGSRTPGPAASPAPEPARAGPEGPRDPGTMGPADPRPTQAAEPDTGRAAPAAAPPECPVQGTPWFRTWDGRGSLNDNIGRLRGELRRWGVHDRPGVPQSIKWRGGDTWVREMALLCLLADTGLAAARQLQLALMRLAAWPTPSGGPAPRTRTWPPFWPSS